MAKENNGRKNGCWNAVYFNQIARRSQKRYICSYANGVLVSGTKTDTIVKENACDYGGQFNNGLEGLPCMEVSIW